MFKSNVVAMGVGCVLYSSSWVGATITILPLGDSITQGYSNAGTPSVALSGGFREPLYEELAAQGIGVQFVGSQNLVTDSPVLAAAGQDSHDGFPGWATADMLGNIAGETAPYLGGTNDGGYLLTGGNGTGRGGLFPNITILSLGTNDYGRNSDTVFNNNLTAILNWFEVNRPNTTVYLASTPATLDQNLFPWDQNNNNNWETWLPEDFPNYHYVDIFDTFLNSDGTANASLLSADGVHPSNAGYQVIANDLDSAIVSTFAVPEPTSLGLIAVAALGSLRRRRKI